MLLPRLFFAMKSVSLRNISYRISNSESVVISYIDSFKTPLDTNMIVAQQANALNLWHLISYAYGIGVIFFLGKLIIEIAK